MTVRFLTYPSGAVRKFDSDLFYDREATRVEAIVAEAVKLAYDAGVDHIDPSRSILEVARELYNAKAQLAYRNNWTRRDHANDERLSKALDVIDPTGHWYARVYAVAA